MKYPLQKKSLSDRDIQVFIGQFLRYGALFACLVTIAGGIIYLYNHGMEPVPDFHQFKETQSEPISFSGIWSSLLSGSSLEIIRLGIVFLIATPILRIALSLFSFIIERDRLYTCITLIVLCIILFSMFSGMKI